MLGRVWCKSHARSFKSNKSVWAGVSGSSVRPSGNDPSIVRLIGGGSRVAYTQNTFTYNVAIGTGTAWVVGRVVPSV